MRLVLAQNASDVDVTDEQSVANFVISARDRFLEISLPFRKEAKDSGGPWKSEPKNLYLIVVNEDRKSAFMHAGDQEAEDRDLTVFGNFVSLINMVKEEETAAMNENRSEEVVCLRYDDHEGVMGRYACAINSSIPTRTGTVDRVIIGGLHHEKLPEEDFRDLPGSSYEPGTEAGDVINAETLKSFVEEAAYALENKFGEGGPPSFSRFRPVLRRTDGPWRKGDIYIFIMLDNNEVIFNANDPSLEDTSLDITDINNCNVGEEIIRVIRGEDRECPELDLLPENPEGFVEYRWDNPDDPNDDDLRFKEGGRKDLSPGITPKLSYVKSVRAPLGNVIVGAGVYPQDTTAQKESDGGCVISGDDANQKSTAFNLVLIAFFLLTATLLKNRSKRKYPA
jgi:hypothetical protein